MVRARAKRKTYCLMLYARLNAAYEQLGEVSRCSVGRHVGYCEKDDDLSARLALKDATLLLH